VGIDIVNVEFISNLSEKSFDRIFLKSEISYCKKKENPDLHFAGRYACKEAILKSFGLSKDAGLMYNFIEIINNRDGRPFVNFHGNLLKYIKKNNISNVHISISHNKEFAVAIAIVI